MLHSGIVKFQLQDFFILVMIYEPEKSRGQMVADLALMKEISWYKLNK